MTTKVEIDPTYERLIFLNEEIKKLDIERAKILSDANIRANTMSASKTTRGLYRRKYSAPAEPITLKLDEYRKERRELSFKYCGKNICIL